VDELGDEDSAFTEEDERLLVYWLAMFECKDTSRSEVWGYLESKVS